MKEKKTIISKVVTFILMLCMVFTLIPSTTYASTLRMKNTNPEVYVGKTIQLKLLGTSKKAKWVSGNTSIATVNSNGLVKAKKPGYVTIRATVGNKVANAGVLVNKPKLNKYVVTLNKGETFTLKLTGASVKKWSSSNSKVASVSSNGKVKALAGGNTTITCVNSSGYSRTCKIIVKDAEVDNSNMSTAYKNTLSGFMKEYNLEYLVNTKPITNGDVDAGWTAQAYAFYGMPTNDNMIQTFYFCDFGDSNPSGYIYTWIEKMSDTDNKTYCNGCKPYDYKTFVVYTAGPTSLSFNHTTFKTGETSGIMRVVNIVPDSKYEWSSSDTSVVSLTHDVTITNGLGQTLTDPVAVHIHANKAGTATITCKVTYPGGETKVCTSEIYVSDTILDEKLPYNTYNDTLNMDEVMATVETEIPNRLEYDATLQGLNIGVDYGGGYGSRFIYWQSFYDYCTQGTIFRNKYYQHLNQYAINNIGYLIFGNLEYQGYTENGIQFGSYSPTMGLMQNYVNLYHK
ncbi:MAG: Ig-like domain-containing protein [Lachnobacterium sp.]|nr:Ig-like domain-containing protein [Lachnobacterium sp.]MDY5460748.1 Ig-like domain-containing protein [Agathobacter sp.]